MVWYWRKYAMLVCSAVLCLFPRKVVCIYVTFRSVFCDAAVTFWCVFARVFASKRRESRFPRKMLLDGSPAARDAYRYAHRYEPDPPVRRRFRGFGLRPARRRRDAGRAALVARFPNAPQIFTAYG